MHPLNTLGIQWLKRSQWATLKFSSWLEAIQSGIFMGLVDDESFQAFDTYPFDETKPVDVSAETERGLEPWERHIVREHFTDAKSVLVVGAGGVRELVGLNELGYDTTGVEFGPALCEASRRELTLRESTATIKTATRFEVPRKTEPYDAVFVARKFISHVHDRTNRIALLEAIRKSLRADAPLVLGFYTRERDTLAFRMQAALANILRRLRGRREFPVEVGDHLDPESPLYHHHFVWEELREELREAGFTPVEYELNWFGWAVARLQPIEERHEAKGSDASEAMDHEQELVESS
ncbi:MAG: hypothetical protein H8E66_22880 [Planctomycetes bacterium]|nr:hypothetical protein [Planctomycetota bacterium]